VVSEDEDNHIDNMRLKVLASAQATALLQVKVNSGSESFFCSTVLTPQHYHWYAATRFAFPGV